MVRRLALLFALAGSFVLGSLTTALPAAAEPVRIIFNSWPGHGPMFVARDKGFFKKRGVEVEITVVEATKDLYSRLTAGQADILGGGVGTSVLYLERSDQFQYIAAEDDSNGGDGMVAVRTIATIGDLKGKKVAFQQGSLAEFYLNYILQQGGLSEADIDLVPVPSSEEAGKAFLARRVDAAVTWEPYLSRARATDFGGTLIDSTATPGVVSDAIITTKEFLAGHPREAKAVVEAWNEAVAYINDHPAESVALMAADFGGWLKDPKVFAETLETVKLYGAEDQRTFFGTTTRPGPLFETVKAAIDIWTTLGRVKVKVTPRDLINFSFVAAPQG